MTPVHLSHERLLELLHYAPATGVFTWRVMPVSHRTKAGDRAGTEAELRPGCLRRIITLDRRKYLSSRLAFFYMAGAWPEMQIDHCNCDALDDRWFNLRQATNSQNNANKRKRKDNKSGFKGVRARNCGRFSARITVSGTEMHIGMFAAAEEASAAYRKAATSVHGEFARHG